MNEVEIPNRSLDSRSAMSVLFEEVNDIDVYIEDTERGYDKLFSLILSRVFMDKYKVNKVFPLGGRDKVIEKYSLDDSTRPFVYIVDGDLYLLSGDSVKNEKGLYILPFYCIENILCDYNSIIKILDEEESCQSISYIEDNIDFYDWEYYNRGKLFDLFVEYAVSKILNPTAQTVAYKVSKLVSCSDGILDNNKVNSRISSVRKNTISVTNYRAYLDTRRKILCSFDSSRKNKMDIVSGKDYLFPLLKNRGKSVVNTKISDINFKQRIARVCDTSKIENIKIYIKE